MEIQLTVKKFSSIFGSLRGILTACQRPEGSPLPQSVLAGNVAGLPITAFCLVNAKILLLGLILAVVLFIIIVLWLCKHTLRHILICILSFWVVTRRVVLAID
jgi:hypothetical protein